MTDQSLPFFANDRCIGKVHDVTKLAGFFRGRLFLDALDQRPSFDAVVALARAVDTVSAADCQAAWHDWKCGCESLEALYLCIGDANGRVEDFSIEADWTIEWAIMADNEFGF